MRPSRETYKRREGARGIGTVDLATLTGLDLDTVTRARKGDRLRRSSVMKIVAALDKMPLNATAAALVGIGALPLPVAKKRTGKAA